MAGDEGGVSEAKHNNLPLLAEDLDEALSQKYKREINETEENIFRGKKMLTEHLNRTDCPCLDGKYLLRFLRAKKYRYDECFECLKNFFKDILITRMYIEGVDSSVFETLLDKTKFISLLPFRDGDGTAILVVRSGIWTDEGLCIEEVTLAILFCLYFLAEQPSAQLAGIRMVLDQRVLYLQEIAPVMGKFRHLLKMLKWYPVRLRSVDMIFSSTVAAVVTRMIINLMPRKVRNKVEVHNGIESLHRKYDTSLLPNELGGTVGPISNNHWLHQVRQFYNNDMKFYMRTAEYFRNM